MKLKRVDKEKWQKCCRWCKNYREGYCYDSFSYLEDPPLYDIAETGHLREVMKESIDSVDLNPFRPIELLLHEWGVSQKRIREFNDTFGKCSEEYKKLLVEQLDEDVPRSYDRYYNKFTETQGVCIQDPENHVCSNWR